MYKNILNCIQIKYMKAAVFLIISLIAEHFSYYAENNKIIIQAGMIKRIISLDQSSFSTENILINNLDIISKGSGELSLSFYSASPNEQPVGITAPTGRATEQSVGIANSTDILKISAEKELLDKKR